MTKAIINEQPIRRKRRPFKKLENIGKRLRALNTAELKWIRKKSESIPTEYAQYLLSKHADSRLVILNLMIESELLIESVSANYQSKEVDDKLCNYCSKIDRFCRIFLQTKQQTLEKLCHAT